MPSTHWHLHPTPFAFQMGGNDQGAPGSQNRWALNGPEVQGMCVCFSR